MAFINADGSSTGVLVNGLPYANRNDGGKITDAGSVSSSRFSSLSLTTDDQITVVSGIDNAEVTAGVWNNNNNDTIMRATTSIAGISSTAMQSASNSEGGRDSIHQTAVIRVRLYKTQVKAGNWNEFTGSWTSGSPAVVNSGGWSNTENEDQSLVLKASGTDVAANPTSTIPGKLQFFVGSGNQPSTQSYATRYLW
jgi:hypothetical protein|tara:strand:- start:3540 stop:4127 length:588 start_codon:yes stop_codon:yes gene_type:complete